MTQVGVVVHGGSTAVPETQHINSPVLVRMRERERCVFIISDLYQVATPSLARMSGSFCLLRLLKVCTAVSKPPGRVHFFPETLLQDPFSLTGWAELRIELSERLHMLTATPTKGGAACTLRM